MCAEGRLELLSSPGARTAPGLSNNQINHVCRSKALLGDLEQKRGATPEVTSHQQPSRAL